MESATDDEELVEEPDMKDDEDFDISSENLGLGSMTKQLKAVILQSDYTTEQPDLTPCRPSKDEELDGYVSRDMESGIQGLVIDKMDFT